MYDQGGGSPKFGDESTFPGAAAAACAAELFFGGKRDPL